MTYGVSERTQVGEPLRVLVTGAAGFAGGYIVRSLLDSGHEVIGFDLAEYRPETRFVIGGDITKVAFEKGSIDDWPRVLEVFMRQRPSAVVHAGGQMDTNFLDEHPMVALQTNVGGTLNMLEASRLVGGVSRFVFLSSIGVIGKRIYEPIDANHPVITATTGPLGAYGAAKVAAESFCLAYQQSFGLDTRIIRPSALYGFGMSWYAPNYMKNIVEPAVLGQPVKLATGGPVPRDYTNVVDLASLVRAVIEGPGNADRVFYAATGLPLRTASDVCSIVRELVPGSQVEIADAWSDVDRAELPIRGQISIDNARTGLGWHPQFSDLRAGIVDYISRVRAYLAAGGSLSAPPTGLVKAPGQA
jgi:nucleoside-diphosphate-sugar epimerase